MATLETTVKALSSTTSPASLIQYLNGITTGGGGGGTGGGGNEIDLNTSYSISTSNIATIELNTSRSIINNTQQTIILNTDYEVEQ